MTKPKDRLGSAPVRRRLPTTYLGVKRRFLVLVRSVAGVGQELDELKTLLHPQTIEEVLNPTMDLTPDTHLLGLLHLFAADLEVACRKVQANRNAWSSEHVSDLQDAVGTLVRERAGARIRDILLEIGKGPGVLWRQDLEFEVWHALFGGQASDFLDISGYAAELRALTAIHRDWWRWNPKLNRLELVWVEEWEELYAEWEESRSEPS